MVLYIQQLIIIKEMELLKKKGIISLLLVFIMIMIGCGNKAPKNIDEEIYKKSVEESPRTLVTSVMS